MTASFVLRLVPGDSLDEIAGEVEAVLTGDAAVVRNVEELLDFLRRHLHRTGGPPA